MKYFTIPALVITIVFSFFLFDRVKKEDLLDEVKNETALTRDLKDLYRAFQIERIIVDQQEWINVKMEDNNADELKNLFRNYIRVCEGLNRIPFYNDTLRLKAHNYISGTIQSYKIAKEKGLESEEFAKDFEGYASCVQDYISYITINPYTTDYLGKMSDSVFQKNYDKSIYIKSVDYPRYEQLKSFDLAASFDMLDSIICKTMDYQEKIAYEIEYADQHVIHSLALEGSPDMDAIGIYKYLLNSHQYSVFLKEIWLKWRTVTQIAMFGESNFSEIPNEMYDLERKRVALTCLKQISKKPRDEVAINMFTSLCLHDIIKRFGDYEYGNQNALEYLQLFPTPEGDQILESK